MMTSRENDLLTLAFMHARYCITCACASTKSMRNSIVSQGCKCQSLIEDCSKAYRTTYDEILRVELKG